eukprot:scaffold152589_cov44-Prasinocladus_malaysianus.AAC.1
MFKQCAAIGHEWAMGDEKETKKHCDFKKSRRSSTYAAQVAVEIVAKEEPEELPEFMEEQLTPLECSNKKYMARAIVDAYELRQFLSDCCDVQLMP